MATTITLRENENKTPKQEAKLVQGESNLVRSLRRLRKHRMAMFGAIILVAVLLFVTVGSLFVPLHRETDVDLEQRLEPPSAAHPFGTDETGRDLFARVIYGGQISLFIGIMAVGVQITVGAAMGLAAGYLGGIVDTLLMRFTEAMLSIPQLFIALIAVKVFSKQPSNFVIGGREFSDTLLLLIFVLGLTSWMRVARIVRSVVLSIKEQEYITAARSLGIPAWRIALRHVLPNCIAPLIVAATLGVANAILLEAYLSFLGVGVRPPSATWGSIISEAYSKLDQFYFWGFPGLFITLTILGINFLGDGLRDAFDPRSMKA